MLAASAAATRGARRGSAKMRLMWGTALAGPASVRLKADPTIATAIALQTHHRSGPVHTSAAAGTGIGSHASRTMSDNHNRTARRRPATIAARAMIAKAARSHQGEGRTPTRDAPASALVTPSVPKDTQSV